MPETMKARQCPRCHIPLLARMDDDGEALRKRLHDPVCDGICRQPCCEKE